MLNTKELQMILLLQRHDYSGRELAQKLRQSRRTIVRNIARINDLLHEHHLGNIDSVNGYHLEVFERSAFEQFLLQVEEQENQVLYLLLINQNISIFELREKLFLSRQNMNNMIEKLNHQYQPSITIVSKIGSGLSLKFKNISRVDVLANLLFNSKVVYREALNEFSEERLDNITDRVKRSVSGRIFDYLNIHQIKVQILSCVICAPLISFDKELSFEPSLVHLRLSKRQIEVITEFFRQKLTLLNQISILQIRTIVGSLEQTYGVNENSRPFVEEIFNHVCRCAMFPTFISPSVIEQIEDLKIRNPFAFDFAFDLTKQLMNKYSDIEIDSEYIALYVLRTFNEPNEKDVRILLFGNQRAIASINITIILEQIKNLDIQPVFSRQELEEFRRKNVYDLVVGNNIEQVQLDKSLKFDFVFDGIITQNDLNLLKK